MIHIQQLLPGVTLRCCRDTRFKQSCMSVQFVRPMCAEEAAMNALIPAVLLRGCEPYPDLQAISRRSEELYGADFSMILRRVGDCQTTGLCFGIMEDRFAIGEDHVLSSAVEFLGQLLLEPLTENGGFRQDYVQSEKQNLCQYLQSQLSNKQHYALMRLYDLMCQGDSYSVPRMGTEEQVEQTDPRGLYDHYQKILRESPVEIFYVGSAAPEEVAPLVKAIFEKIPRDFRPAPAHRDLTPSEGSHESEVMDIRQGKLCMGFTTPITHRREDFVAMAALNAILGGTMTSKLFMVIREQMSLCYSIHSQYMSAKGLLVVCAGIDFDKEDLTRREILNQLEACRKGQITPQEMTAAREALTHGLKVVWDSPGAIENFFATRGITDMILDYEGYCEAVRELTMEQVAAAAGTVSLHSSFFLKGETQ